MAASRIGVGFDAHPFAAGVTLRLGGVEIAHPRGLSGHSDGDVLLHAIADALMGAAGLPSLGEVFSDRDPRWKGADSSVFLAHVRNRVRERGLEIGNLDAVVIGEAPRVAPHAAAIRARIASILKIEESAVSIRGTSTNGLGFPGRGEGLAAMAVVLLGSEREGRDTAPAG